MNQNNDISADYLRQQQEIQEGYFMLLDELYKNDQKLLFCFFETKKSWAPFSKLWH